MRGHRFDHVGHAENTRFEQNSVPFESLRIARTIHALMVLQHHLSDRILEMNILQNIITGLRMGFNQAVLNVTKPSRLAQYFCRNFNFSKVMHNARQVNGLNLRVGQSHLSGNGCGQIGYPDLVPGGIGIAQFNDTGNRPHRVFQIALQLR